MEYKDIIATGLLVMASIAFTTILMFALEFLSLIEPLLTEGQIIFIVLSMIVLLVITTCGYFLAGFFIKEQF